MERCFRRAFLSPSCRHLDVPDASLQGGSSAVQGSTLDLFCHPLLLVGVYPGESDDGDVYTALDIKGDSGRVSPSLSSQSSPAAAGKLLQAKY